MDIKNKRKKEFETKVKDFMKKTNDDMYKRRQNFYILQDIGSWLLNLINLCNKLCGIFVFYSDILLFFSS